MTPAELAQPGDVTATTWPGLWEVDLLYPHPDTIRLEDIAYSLGRLPRWNGYTRRTWSVAEHSVRVSELVPREHAMAGLLHDAAEAYTGDIIAPLKGVLSGIAEIEERLLGAVFAALGPDRLFVEATEKRDPVPRYRVLMPESVIEADHLMRELEERDLRDGLKRNACPEHPDYEPLRANNSAEFAAQLFLTQYKQLAEFERNRRWWKIKPPAHTAETRRNQ